ncbi:plant/protein [Wolffia australiana]
MLIVKREMQEEGGKRGTVKRVVYGDEEGRHRVEKVAVPETRRPDTLRYVERKMCEKGINRMERRPVDGQTLKCGPHKSGHGGRFTWEGPDDVAHSQLDPAPAAVDAGDPNFDAPAEEEGKARAGPAEDSLD